MRNILIVTALVLSFSNAFAVTMADFAYSPDVGDTSVKISMMGFKDRYFAKQFCQKLGMKLADPKTIEAITVTTAPQTSKRLHDAIYFKIDGKQGELKGFWGWLPEESSPDKKLDIFIQFDGDPQKSADNFEQMNNLLLSNGFTPYKLPAICEK